MSDFGDHPIAALRKAALEAPDLDTLKAVVAEIVTRVEHNMYAVVAELTRDPGPPGTEDSK